METSCREELKFHARNIWPAASLMLALHRRPHCVKINRRVVVVAGCVSTCFLKSTRVFFSRPAGDRIMSVYYAPKDETFLGTFHTHTRVKESDFRVYIFPFFFERNLISFDGVELNFWLSILALNCFPIGATFGGSF